jgi:predicted nucleotidyltransferase
METKQIKKVIKKNVRGKSIFYSLSGSHLYGFASPDSDYDVRGCHAEPTKNILGLRKPWPTIDSTEGEIDFVSHEIEKFIGLMIKPNGNVLEQLNSPHVIHTSKEYRTLKSLSKDCICKRLYFHYNGMAMQNYKKFIDHQKTTVKKYLYVLRSLMAGIHVLEKGKIEANILELNKYFKFDVVKELVKLKKKEKITMPKNSALNNKAQKLIADLFTRLRECRDNSKLPEEPKIKKLNEFLLEIRRQNL